MIPCLQVENLTKSFGDLVLFNNLSFGIGEGDRVGLIAKKWNRKDYFAQHPNRPRRLRFGNNHLPS